MRVGSLRWRMVIRCRFTWSRLVGRTESTDGTVCLVLGEREWYRDGVLGWKSHRCEHIHAIVWRLMGVLCICEAIEAFDATR